MTTQVSLAPLPIFQFNQGGIPLSGGKLFTYQAGTAIKQTTYLNSDGSTPNTNPIILDTNGQCVVYLSTGLNYKFTLSPSTDTDPPTNPFWTADNLFSNVVPALPYSDAGGSSDAITGTYIVSTPILYDGYPLLLDIATPNTTTTPTFAPTLNGILQNARTIVKFINNVAVPLSIGDLQGVVSLVYNLPGLVWVVQNPATLQNATNLTGYSTVASAVTPDIWTNTGNVINYTGTATATGFPAAPSAGAQRKLICTGACLFTAGANLLIEGISSGNSITLAANAIVNVLAISTTQFKLTYSVSGTFTATGTGFSGATSVTWSYSVINGICTINMTPIVATSNATSFTVTGIPIPASPQGAVFVSMYGEDNGAFITTGPIFALINASGTMTLSKTTQILSNWTNTGLKGITTPDAYNQCVTFKMSN